MVEKMPEAAKLYFDNWDVLDTARTELFSVFSDFWPSTWPIIQELSEAEGLVTPIVREILAPPGRWKLNGRGKAKKGQGKTPDRSMFKFTGVISVCIDDPRRSKNINVYSVSLRCSGANLKRLENEQPGASDKIDALSKEHSLDLDWEDSWQLCKRDIAVDPEDLTATWRKVAETAVELLSFVKEAEATVA